MKSLVSTSKWLFASLIALTCAGAYSQQMSVSTPSGFELKRGVNLSHWLSQNFGWSPKDTFITEKDIAYIASVGYDHVRVPIDEAEMWTAEGKPIEQSFTYLTHCLDWCQKHKLRAIVDLHILRAHYFNAANEGGTIQLWTDPAAQATFIRLWTELSGRLKKYPVDRVAYELMNEPVAPDPEDWNKLIARAFQAVRKLEPGRVIVIGANRWQTPSSFPYLKVPANDPNIILSLHTYAPLFFTHHTADWVPFKDYTGPVHYPGLPVPAAELAKYATASATNADVLGAIDEAREVFDKDKMLSMLRPAIQRARELHLPLYCGEFGCLPHVDRAERLKYYDDLISTFEENHIAWCNWEYKGDFGIYKFDFKKKLVLDPDADLIKVFMRERKVPASG
ncbi:MAG TPA: cellulase family glycosylhydrolase [Verrucomicrobiae bacterium]|nr:cellulase family glycosylhydrolase [Verrucomicrobiae bacterium]